MLTRITVIITFIALQVVPCFSQQNGKCPTIDISGPSGVIPVGGSARYTVQVSPVDASLQLTYRWSLSAGEIRSGQGTRELEIIQPTGIPTVNVEIEGLPNDCPNTASETYCVLPPPATEKLATVGGTITLKKLAIIKDQLDKYPDKNVQFFLIVSGTKQNPSVTKKVDTLKRFFGDNERITYVDSERTDDSVVFLGRSSRRYAARTLRKLSDVEAHQS